jgi:hypothetical protein
MSKIITVKGSGCIQASLIKHSTHGVTGREILTYVVDFNRFFLAEVNTHRALTKSGASSRAIPLAAMIDTIRNAPAMPVYWGKNEPGMKARAELEPNVKEQAEQIWLDAIKDAIKHANRMGEIGAHKQLANRITELGMMQRMVITGTDWNNFFWLRDHPDAQPEFRELSRVMFEAKNQSVPDILYPGEWHTPFVHTQRDLLDKWSYFDSNLQEIDVDVAKKISASCCAQASFRKSDDSIEKANKIFDMLHLGSDTEPSHASPTEHQASPMETSFDMNDEWPEGITHMARDKKTFFSGNLREWIQYRQLIPNNVKVEF